VTGRPRPLRLIADNAEPLATTTATAARWLTPVPDCRRTEELRARLVVAAQQWAEIMPALTAFDHRTPQGQATLSLLDAVHELDVHLAGQRVLFPEFFV